MKNSACVSPFQTLKPHERQCILNTSMKSHYWRLALNTEPKNCQTPCASMDINMPPYSIGTENPSESFVRIYLKGIIKVQTSYWSYPIISLLAEVGGYVGLLLGISLMEINKVFHWFYRRFQ